MRSIWFRRTTSQRRNEAARDLTPRIGISAVCTPTSRSRAGSHSPGGHAVVTLWPRRRSWSESTRTCFSAPDVRELEMTCRIFMQEIWATAVQFGARPLGILPQTRYSLVRERMRFISDYSFTWERLQQLEGACRRGTEAGPAHGCGEFTERLGATERRHGIMRAQLYASNP